MTNLKDNLLFEAELKHRRKYGDLSRSSSARSSAYRKPKRGEYFDEVDPEVTPLVRKSHNQRRDVTEEPKRLTQTPGEETQRLNPVLMRQAPHMEASLRGSAMTDGRTPSMVDSVFERDTPPSSLRRANTTDL